MAKLYNTKSYIDSLFENDKRIEDDKKHSIKSYDPKTAFIA